MAQVYATSFDSIADWSVVAGTPAVSSAQSVESSNSVLFTCAGAASNMYRVETGRIVVTRFYYRIETDASGTSLVTYVQNATGNMTLQGRTGRKLRPVIGATNGTESSVMNLDQWYRIDAMFRSDSGTRSIDYSIDGVAQTSLTASVTASDNQALQLGNTQATTFKFYVDALQHNDAAADYPIGALSVPLDPFGMTGFFGA